MARRPPPPPEVATHPSARFVRQWSSVLRTADPAIDDTEAERRAVELWHALREIEEERDGATT